VNKQIRIWSRYYSKNSHTTADHQYPYRNWTNTCSTSAQTGS